MGQPRTYSEAQVDLTRTLHNGTGRRNALECPKGLFADFLLYELHILSGFGVELVHFQLFGMELLIFGRSVEISGSSGGL